MISGYNTGLQPVKVSFFFYMYPFTVIILTFPQNLVQIIFKAITMHGLFFLNLMPKYGAQFNAEISAKIASGEIKHREHIYDLAKGGEAILAVQKGYNNGKAVIHVADE